MLPWILGIVASLGLVGTIGAAIAFPAIVIPILQKVAGAILKCRPCMAVLAAIALLVAGALYGVHVEGLRCEARMEKMRRAAAAAAEERDAGVKADLEKDYRPKIAALELRAKSLQGEVAKYAKRVPVAKTGGACKLGDAAGLLQPRQPR